MGVMWCLSILLGGSILSGASLLFSREDALQGCRALFGGLPCSFLGLADPAPRATNSLRGRSHTNVKVQGRLAHVYVPGGAARSGGTPAIVVLHGSYSSPKDMFGLGFEPLADEHGFLVVYPEMQVPSSASWGYEDDIPFMTKLAGKLQKDFGADPTRIFVCGHSAGGTMSLFLQNEVTIFAAAAAVEAGVGHLKGWTMNKRGNRTIVIWNHDDPVLAEYGGEDLYRQTLKTLRRHGSMTPPPVERLPIGGHVISAELQRYPEDGSPELWDLSWRSKPGTHDWPQEAGSLDGDRWPELRPRWRLRLRLPLRLPRRRRLRLRPRLGPRLALLLEPLPCKTAFKKRPAMPEPRRRGIGPQCLDRLPVPRRGAQQLVSFFLNRTISA